MADIDLIPTDYRNLIWLKSKIKLLGVSIASMLAITAMVFMVMQFTTSKLNGKINALQKQQEITTHLHAEIARLNENKQNLEHQLAVLNSLRSGAAAPEMFTTIDRAMSDGDVWFESWEFRRAGSTVTQKEATSSNVYFIIPSADKDETTDTAWKIETHMTIKGQAKDHSALSLFVRRLYNQPEIHNVKILNTTTAANMKAVDFNLAVTVYCIGING